MKNLWSWFMGAEDKGDIVGFSVIVGMVGGILGAIVSILVFSSEVDTHMGGTLVFVTVFAFFGFAGNLSRMFREKMTSSFAEMTSPLVSEEYLPELHRAAESLKGCIDAAKQIGKPEVLTKARKTQKLLLGVAFEARLIRLAHQKTSSAFEQDGLAARMNAIRAELVATQEYFEGQRKIIEDSLASVGRNPVMLEELPSTSALSSIIGNDIKTEVESDEAPAKETRVLRIDRKNGTER